MHATAATAAPAAPAAPAATPVPTRANRAPEAVANRKAAFVWSAVFLALSAAVAVFCSRALDPSRRLHYFRQSALEFVEREQWRQAALQLGNVVQLAPHDAQAWFQLGLVELKSAPPPGEDTLTRAVHDFRRAAELDPTHWQALRWLLELELRAGDWAEARVTARRLAELQPEHPLVTLAFDVLPTDESNHDANDLSDGAGIRRQALALHQAGARLKSRRLLEDAARKYPRSGRLACLRAELALADGDSEAAAAHAAEAFDGVCAASARLLAAEAYERLADLDEAAAVYWANAAAEHYREALAAHSDQPAARRHLADLLTDKLGRRAEAADLRGAPTWRPTYRVTENSTQTATARMKE